MKKDQLHKNTLLFKCVEQLERKDEKKEEE